jgi:hypothetical protein
VRSAAVTTERHSPGQPEGPGGTERRRAAERRLAELVAEAHSGLRTSTIERRIVKELLRCYHGLDIEGRRALAAAEPPLTGTIWDAVIAAAVEHACSTHDEPTPAWAEKPERFLREPWVSERCPIDRGTALNNAPGAFIRHNTFIEVRNLDERGGERHVWAADERPAPQSIRPPQREAPRS